MNSIVICTNCNQRTELRPLPPPLSGFTCRECGWISNRTGGEITSPNGKPYVYSSDPLTLLTDDERKQRLRAWSNPNPPELKLYGPGFFLHEPPRPYLRPSYSMGIDLASVRAHRAQAAVLQHHESERLLRAFRENGISVSESAVRKGLMAPAEREDADLALPRAGSSSRSLSASQSVPVLPRAGSGPPSRNKSATLEPSAYPSGSGRKAAAALGRKAAEAPPHDGSSRPGSSALERRPAPGAASRQSSAARRRAPAAAGGGAEAAVGARARAPADAAVAAVRSEEGSRRGVRRSASKPRTGGAQPSTPSREGKAGRQRGAPSLAPTQTGSTGGSISRPGTAQIALPASALYRTNRPAPVVAPGL